MIENQTLCLHQKTEIVIIEFKDALYPINSTAMAPLHPSCSLFQPRRFSSQLSPILFFCEPPRLQRCLLLQRPSCHKMASFHQPPSEPRPISSPGFKSIDASILIEEESIPNYKARRYYPARIGEVLNARYQLVGKLGYSSSSTVWLCRDLLYIFHSSGCCDYRASADCSSREHRYVALKVYVNSSKTHRELPIYERLKRIQTKHPGRRCLRMLLDSFEIAGPHGRHCCLVHQPLGMSLHDLKLRARDRVFSKDVLRSSVRQLLAALDYLHNEAHVIHTGKACCLPLMEDILADDNKERSTTKQPTYGGR